MLKLLGSREHWVCGRSGEWGFFPSKLLQVLSGHGPCITPGKDETGLGDKIFQASSLCLRGSLAKGEPTSTSIMYAVLLLSPFQGLNLHLNIFILILGSVLWHSQECTKCCCLTELSRSLLFAHPPQAPLLDPSSHPHSCLQYLSSLRPSSTSPL